MKNKEIEQLGTKAVIEQERKHERTIVDNRGGRGEGFDLATKDASNNIRLIELKATTKSRPMFRYLEQKEYGCLEKSDNYWIYVVTGIPDVPCDKPFSKEEIMKKIKRKEIKWVCSFSSQDFKAR